MKVWMLRCLFIYSILWID